MRYTEVQSLAKVYQEPCTMVVSTSPEVQHDVTQGVSLSLQTPPSIC